jgi:hypothetical protein
VELLQLNKIGLSENSSRKKNLFTSKLDLSLRVKLLKCYVWNIPLYGAEMGTLQKADQKYLESLKCNAGEA